MNQLLGHHYKLCSDSGKKVVTRGKSNQLSDFIEFHLYAARKVQIPACEKKVMRLEHDAYASFVTLMANIFKIASWPLCLAYHS